MISDKLQKSLVSFINEVDDSIIVDDGISWTLRKNGNIIECTSPHGSKHSFKVEIKISRA